MRNIIFLGLISFFMDISSEMVYPIIPLYLTSAFGATPAIVGIIEGIAESTASLLRSGKVLLTSVYMSGFDNVQPTYQMIKALVKNVPDIIVDKDHLVMISPDEGAMQRCMYYSSVLGIDIGMFYKRRNYSVIVNGRNPIEAHEYLGQDLHGKDVIIVDDMIASGDSLLDVAKQLKEKGAKRIFNFATFGLFTSGFEKFDKAYEAGLIDKIFTTNLVYHKPELEGKEWWCEVNMCKYVAFLIDTLNHDDTISSLLDPVDRINNVLVKYGKR